MLHTHTHYLSFFMLNKCEQNTQQKQITRKTSQTNEMLLFSLAFQRRCELNRQPLNEKYRNARFMQKSLEHDEMQILLQIAIIISERNTMAQVMKEKQTNNAATDGEKET